jgi:SAM-dependent methyltransferase
MSAGSGPGHITADGCPVDLYAAMRPGREPDLIASAVAAGATILELGAGAGRVTNELSHRGFRVVAVDDSVEMLAHVRDAETVHASIEGLDLGRRFDAVLLCSHLINAPAAQRQQFLATCVRHVVADGCVIIERHDPRWFDTATEQVAEHDGITYRLRGLSRPAPGLLGATVEYAIGERLWSHTFVTECVDDDLLDASLAPNGLVVDRYLDEDRTWVRAVPGKRETR